MIIDLDDDERAALLDALVIWREAVEGPRYAHYPTDYRDDLIAAGNRVAARLDPIPN